MCRINRGDRDLARYVPTGHTWRGHCHAAQCSANVDENFTSTENSARILRGQRWRNSFHALSINAKPSNIACSETWNAVWCLRTQLNNAICDGSQCIANVGEGAFGPL